MKIHFTLFAALLSLNLIAQNLLTNGNAESGDLEGWTAATNAVNAVTIVNQTNGIVNPFEGDFFFTFSNAASDSSSLFQSGQIEVPLELLRLSGYFHGEALSDDGDDFGEAILYVFDSDSIIIDSVSTGELQPVDPDSWIEFMIQIPINSESYLWGVKLKGNKQFGSFINVFYDDLVLTNEMINSITNSDLSIKTIIYPNPASNWLEIEGAELLRISKIEIYQSNGAIAKSIFGQQIKQIDLSNLEPDKYIIIGYNDGNKIVLRESFVKINQ